MKDCFRIYWLKIVFRESSSRDGEESVIPISISWGSVVFIKSWLEIFKV